MHGVNERARSLDQGDQIHTVCGVWTNVTYSTWKHTLISPGIIKPGSIGSIQIYQEGTAWRERQAVLTKGQQVYEQLLHFICILQTQQQIIATSIWIDGRWGTFTDSTLKFATALCIVDYSSYLRGLTSYPLPHLLPAHRLSCSVPAQPWLTHSVQWIFHSWQVTTELTRAEISVSIGPALW